MTKMTRQMKENSWTVPWIHQVDWEEMLLFARNMCEGLGETRPEVMRHIHNIIALYGELDAPLSRLCTDTCPACKDVCCTKATVWYDQRDIIVYHLATDSFPDKQVSKSVTGTCCHLRENGCRLPRLERPFICTWYICSGQTVILNRNVSTPGAKVQEQIHQIKEARKKIESLCLQM